MTRLVEISQQVLGLYPEAGAHGRKHAEETFTMVQQISQASEYRGKISEKNLAILGASSLLHDVGYLGVNQDYVSGTQWEHPYHSASTAQEILRQIPWFDPFDVELATFLILNHDNTNFSFPALKRFERLKRYGVDDPFGQTDLPPGALVGSDSLNEEFYDKLSGEVFFPLLHILQEADSRLGSAQRTFDFSVSRNVPIVSQEGGIGMLMWQGTALANVMLAAKRALLDTYTQGGQELAWRIFEESRSFALEKIKEVKEMRQEPIGQLFDPIGCLLRWQDVEQFIWEKGEGRFDRATRITQVFPAETAHYLIGQRVISKLVDVEKVKDGREYGDDKFFELSTLRRKLIGNYALDILTETNGVIRVITDQGVEGGFPSKEWTLIPPVVKKKYGEYQTNTGSFPWVDLARELGIEQIRVLIAN